MVEPVIVNATMAISSVMNASQIGWFVTTLVFIVTFITLILAFKNFRRAMYGAIVSGLLYGMYAFSRWIGVSYASGDKVPSEWFSYIAGFILASIVIGWCMDKLGWLDKIDGGFDGDTIKKTRRKSK
jgi:4-hydroxybenzoate polyprenyltransferase